MNKMTTISDRIVFEQTLTLIREVAIMKISTLFSVIKPVLNNTLMNQLTVVTESLLTMTGRITMLGISRWSDKGGSYRTIQRFFHSAIPWCSIQWALIQHHLLDSDDVILFAGDETTVTKSGKATYGLGRFLALRAFPWLT
jgi:putative transposase